MGRIIYTSLLRAPESPLGLATEHVATEQALAASGVPATILRNGWYSENHAGTVAGALAQGAVVGASGEGRISSATRADYADAIVAAATRDETAGRTYELAGDESWSLAELAALLSDKTGREIPFRNLTVEAYAEVLQGAGLPPDFAGFLAAMETGIESGALEDNGRALSTLIGRPTTPLAEWVATML